MTLAAVPLADVVALGILLPDSFVRSGLFAVLAAFVAINTVMYTALAIAKMLPKVHPSDFVNRRGRRAETRSIDPDAGAN